jgi:calcineurin-like phosphoesterase family protein
MTIWFTADQHFDHDGIISACNRPFQTTRHMNKEIIKRYQTFVNDEDDVYIIGDLCLKGPEYLPFYKNIIKQLPGQKHLIFGNHDKLSWEQYIDVGFTSVHSSLIIKNKIGVKYILNHDPASSCINRNLLWLCGHIHNLFRTCKNVINVGVDVWDYRPVSIEQIDSLWWSEGEKIATNFT